MENNLSNPEVSIIIPTRNRAGTLSRAIQSVISQTFKNWEALILDDGSTDNTPELMKNYESDSRIIYQRHGVCLGVSENRNTGIRQARGKYVAFLDSDDEWLPTKLEKQLAVFESPDHPGLVYTSARFIDLATNNTRIRHARVRGNVFDEVLATNPIGTPSSVMVLGECFSKVGYLDPSMPTMEDWELWIRISEKYFIDFVDEPLINYFEGRHDSMTLKSDIFIQGYRLIWDKYNVTSKNILKIHYSKLAHRLCYSGNLRRGRYYLRQALSLEWYNPKILVLFLLTFLGLRLYQKFTFLILKITK